MSIKRAPQLVARKHHATAVPKQGTLAVKRQLMSGHRQASGQVERSAGAPTERLEHHWTGPTLRTATGGGLRATPALAPFPTAPAPAALGVVPSSPGPPAPSPPTLFETSSPMDITLSGAGRRAPCSTVCPAFGTSDTSLAAAASIARAAPEAPASSATPRPPRT